MTDTAAHPLPTDPQVLAYIARTQAFYPPESYTFTLAQNRALYDRYAAEMRGPMPAGVSATDFEIVAQQPSRWLAARRYQRSGPRAQDRTVLMYVHGGGFMLGGLDSHADVCAGLCAATGLDVVAITYRLAPEHLHPAQGDDVQAAFLHLSAGGQRVLACGDSAGGNLVAALCLRQKAQGGVQPIGQVLIYPGLGGDPTQGSYLENAHAPMLTTQETLYYFSLRLGEPAPALVHDPELRPLLATDLSGLPPAFVVTADIDPLRDDGRHYVERLQAAGVAASYRNEPELVHGYLRARHMSARAAQSFAAICAAAAALAGATV